MKTFRFRGERLLEWRRRRADDARADLLRTRESLQASMALTADAEERVRRASAQLSAAMASPTTVETIVRYRNWIEHGRTDAARCRQNEIERREAVDRAADRLREAALHVKMMERLRDRAWRRFVDEERRAEMKALNELAAIQYTKQRARRGIDRGH